MIGHVMGNDGLNVHDGRRLEIPKADLLYIEICILLVSDQAQQLRNTAATDSHVDVEIMASDPAYV
jgi:hypothetical protein